MLASYVIPTEEVRWDGNRRLATLNRGFRRSQSIGGGSKGNPKNDGIRKHRSHAYAQPNAGMTCFLKPAFSMYKGAILFET